MAKTLIKIAIALIVLHGAFRLGMAYWDYYRFEDALQQMALFGLRRPDRQLCEEAMATAAGYNLPIGPSDLAVVRGNNPPFNCGGGQALPFEGRPTRSGELGFQGMYVEQVLLLPGYVRPWEFKVQVAVRAAP